MIRKRMRKTDENELDCEEEVEGEVEEQVSTDQTTLKREEEELVWKIGGKKVDERTTGQYGPCLACGELDLFEDDSILDYLFLFFPTQYIKEVLLVAINAFALQQNPNIEEFTFNKFICVLGMLYAMEVNQLLECRMYWLKESTGMFPAMDFGRNMSQNRFEDFLYFWQLSETEDCDLQVLEFISAVNDALKKSIVPGDTLCLDESMIKAYHRNLRQNENHPQATTNRQ